MLNMWCYLLEGNTYHTCHILGTFQNLIWYMLCIYAEYCERNVKVYNLTEILMLNHDDRELSLTVSFIIIILWYNRTYPLSQALQVISKPGELQKEWGKKIKHYMDLLSYYKRFAFLKLIIIYRLIIHHKYKCASELTTKLRYFRDFPYTHDTNHARLLWLWTILVVTVNCKL